MASNPLTSQQRIAQGIPKLEGVEKQKFYFGDFVLPNQGEILTISGEAGSGKTYFSVSLLSKLQQAGKRCLLLDLDESKAYGLANSFTRKDNDLPELMSYSPQGMLKANEVNTIIAQCRPDVVLIDSFFILANNNSVKGRCDTWNEFYKGYLASDLRPAIIATFRGDLNSSILKGIHRHLWMDMPDALAQELYCIMQKDRINDDCNKGYRMETTYGKLADPQVR